MIISVEDNSGIVGIKKVYEINDPYYIPKKKELSIEEEELRKKKDEEYRSIHEHRVKKNNEEYQNYLNKQKMLNKERINAPKSDKEVKNYNHRIRSDFNEFDIIPSIQSKLTDKFIENHKINIKNKETAYTYYKDIPIYFDLNGNHEHYKSYIIGYGRGFKKTYEFNNRNSYKISLSIILTIPLDVYKWIRETHINPSIEIDEENNLYIACDRIYDPNMPMYINSINGRKYTEIEVMELDADYELYKSLVLKRKNINTTISKLNDKYATYESLCNYRDETENDNENYYKKILNDLKTITYKLNNATNTRDNIELEIKDVKKRINSFHCEHVNPPEDGGFINKWSTN